MPGAGELADPVAYAPVWSWLAWVLPVVVLLWYAGVTWWTRDEDASPVPARMRARVQAWRARREHLRRLARIEAEVSHGALSAREAHQAVSATVRSFVAAVSPLDARTMNLEQLRAAAPPAVVALVEHAYPPAFRAGHSEAEERLGPALQDARALVEGWRP